MIDFKEFTSKKDKIFPIINQRGIIDGRKIKHNVENGWYLFEISSKIKKIRSATPLEIEKTINKSNFPRFTGYPIGTEVIPNNFEIIKRLGEQETVTVQFLNENLFSFISFIKWEDGNYYYHDTVSSPKILKELRGYYDENKSLSGLQGITPELRYYFLLLQLQKGFLQAFKPIRDGYVISKDREVALQKLIKLEVGDIIRSSIISAGGKFLRHHLVGENYLVEWKIGGQLVKSVIKKDLRLINAGFCLSGYDKDHSLNSIVNLAKLFQEDEPLYITRE